MGYLLDTNAIINYLAASLPVAGMEFLGTIVDREPVASVVTQMETLGYNFKSVEEQAVMEIFINGSTIIGLSNEIVNTTISLRKSKRMKLPDAIIAATALVHGLILVSRNTADFKDIQGLQVIDPHQL